MFGSDIAVNAANFFYFYPLLYAAKVLSGALRPKAQAIIIEEMTNVHLGQALDIFWHKNVNMAVTERQYLEMCRLKTATMARLAARLGVLVAHGTPAQELALARFAETLGMAFQIRDDLENITGAGRPGKGFGDDITEGKRSLPVIRALQKLPPRQGQELKSILASHPSDPLQIKPTIAIITQTDQLRSFQIQRGGLVMEIQRDVPLAVERTLAPAASFEHDLMRSHYWFFTPNNQGAAVIGTAEIKYPMLIAPDGEVSWLADTEEPFMTWPVAQDDAFLAVNTRELLKINAAGEVIEASALARRVIALVNSPALGPLAVAYEGGGRCALYRICQRPFGLDLASRRELYGFEGRLVAATPVGLAEINQVHPTALALAVYDLKRGRRSTLRLGAPHPISWWQLSPNGQLVWLAANVLYTASILVPAEEVNRRELKGDQVKAMIGGGLAFNFERAVSVSKSRSSPSVTFAGLAFRENEPGWTQWGVWWPEREQVVFFTPQEFLRVRALTAVNGVTYALAFNQAPPLEDERWHPAVLRVEA